THADVARAPQRDGAFGVVLRKGLVGPAHEAALPGRGVERRHCAGDAAPGDVPREGERAVDPQTAPGRAGFRIAPRHLDLVHALRPLPRGVRDGMTRGVELVCAVLLRVGPAPGRGEP